jgi:hypothetical protein
MQYSEDILHESRKSEHSTDSTDIETEQHATETGRCCQSESPPAIDLRRVLSSRLVLDNLVHDAGGPADLHMRAIRGRLGSGVHDEGLGASPTIVVETLDKEGHQTESRKS